MMRRLASPRRGKQRGISLFIVVIMLLLTTLLVAWGAKTSLLNEKITGNDSDYLRAVEAAQAMVQDAVLDINGETFPGVACTAAVTGNGCRTGGAVNISTNTAYYPASKGDFDDLLALLAAGTPSCAGGICVPANVNPDFWSDETSLAAMKPSGAAYGTGNGLGVPRLIDLNGDGAADVAYAGDLLGNMWKFELNSATPGDWKVAFNDAPLFKANVGTPATSQPITTAPVWRPHPDGGLVLVFATGRNLTVADTTDTQQQTIYGIYDRTIVSGTTGLGAVVLSGGSTVAGRSALQMQSVSSAVTAVASTGNNFWTVSGSKVDYKGVSGTAQSGWYLDLPVSKERTLKNPSWFAGDLVDIPSVVPQSGASGETCDPVIANAVNYFTTVDAINGARPNSQIYGYTSTSAAVATEHASRYVGAEGIGLTQGNKEVKKCLGADCVEERILPGWSRKLPSWRQLR